MKVKIGHTIYDPNAVPVMLMLDDTDKRLIASMKPIDKMIAFGPESMSEDELKMWMHGKIPWVGEVKGIPAPIGISPLLVEYINAEKG